MRIPQVLAPSAFLTSTDGIPGFHALLGHLPRSLRELAIAIDLSDEAKKRFDRAARDWDRDLSAAMQSESPLIPANFDRDVNYWRQRRLVAGKMAVLSLTQVREVLLDIRHLTRGSEALETVRLAAAQALNGFEAAFPDVQGMRDSIAHSNARARWVANKRSADEISLALSDADLGPFGFLYSDYMSSAGDFDGNRLTLRILKAGVGAAGSLDVCDETLNKARDLVQQFVDALPWSNPGKREPLKEFKASF